MRVLLLGDSHLARLSPGDLGRIAPDVTNAAVGGASAPDLARQVAGIADLPSYDVVVVSVGTNDAAPWKQVPIETSERALADAVARLPKRPAMHVVYVASPGVDETRLDRVPDRTNEVLADYSRVAAHVVSAAGGAVVDTPAVLAPLGRAAYLDDGLHLTQAAYELLVPAIAGAVG